MGLFSSKDQSKKQQKATRKYSAPKRAVNDAGKDAPLIQRAGKDAPLIRR